MQENCLYKAHFYMHSESAHEILADVFYHKYENYDDIRS